MSGSQDSHSYTGTFLDLNRQSNLVDKKPLAIALMGPTAAGKTDLAIALKQQLNAEVISVDSTLVYKGLDIGSAKPSPEEQALAPHRLIDIRDPKEPYSAADFCRDAKREIADIVASEHVPLLTGGTMMYFKALLEGLSDLPVADEKVRADINSLAQEKGWSYIHQKLQEVDPSSAEKIHPNHSQRLSRAYEIYLITGEPMSKFHGQLQGGVLDQYDWVQIAIAPRDRHVLHERIAQRFELMLQAGIIKEVERLKARGDLHKDLPAMRSVGYRQVWEFLEGEYNYEEMVDKGVVATRQLAKRQLTWLRSWQDLNWLYTQDESGNMLSLQRIQEKALNFVLNGRI